MSAYDGTVTVADPNLVESFDHEDGSKTFIVYDIDSGSDNPRDWDNCSEVVCLNGFSGYSAAEVLDGKDSYLADALAGYAVCGDLDEMKRRLERDGYGIAAIDRVDTQSSAYIGVITVEEATRELLTDPVATLKSELEVLRAWADGEVYGYIHVGADGVERDSCWGFVGCDSLADIAAEATASPIV